MIETWKQPPPIEDSVDIVNTALKLQSAQFSLTELPETATILDQNALKQSMMIDLSDHAIGIGQASLDHNLQIRLLVDALG